MENYTCTQVENLLNRYVQKGGEIITVEEGCLGYGITIATGHKLKTAVIKEYFINSWTSGHTITMYNNCPKKYLKHLNN